MYSYFISKINYRNSLYTCLFISVICVAASFIFQFYLDLLPCKICMYQRYLWLILLPTSMICLFVNEKHSFSVTVLLLIIISSIFFTGLYHSLIELSLVKNYFSCTQGIDKNIETIEELDNLIRNTKNQNCAISKYNIFGLTLANYSILISLFLLIFHLIVLKKKLFTNYDR